MFHPSLTWVDASSVPGIAEGWIYNGATFSKPVIPEFACTTSSIAEMQAQIAILAAELSKLSVCLKTS
jgi:hypothetical protein